MAGPAIADFGPRAVPVDPPRRPAVAWRKRLRHSHIAHIMSQCDSPQISCAGPASRSCSIHQNLYLTHVKTEFENAR